MEGNVSYMTVNKNGAVGVVLTGTTYKSVIVMYGITGNEEFRTYLSSTVATSLAISENSEYLSLQNQIHLEQLYHQLLKQYQLKKLKVRQQSHYIYI